MWARVDHGALCLLPMHYGCVSVENKTGSNWGPRPTFKFNLVILIDRYLSTGRAIDSPFSYC